MGYYTSYSLSTDDESFDLESFIKDNKFTFALDEDGGTQCATKWYDHEEDMKKASLKHPNILFTLCGFGENPGDIWNKYFKNGKMQVCQAEIVYPEFNEDKLV